MAALMKCTRRSIFYGIVLIFAFRGRSSTMLMDHGAMFRIMLGWTRANQQPCKMRERVKLKCVRYVVTSAPPSRVVVSVLTSTLVGIRLFMRDILSDILCC